MQPSRFLASLSNIYRLGLKELRSLLADKVLLVLIVWAFLGGVYVASTATSTELHNAPVAVVDEDQSPLSRRLTDALYPPYFKVPTLIALKDMDPVMDKGLFSFTIVIPANFQRDVVAGRSPEVQLNIDATNMSQSFIGASYIQAIAAGEISEFLTGTREATALPITLVTRARFNPNLTGRWFGGVMEVISNVTMLTIILVGAALIREREHGTIEHLLVMPLAPFEIMLAKIWANGLAVLIGATFALTVIVQQVLRVPIAVRGRRRALPVRGRLDWHLSGHAGALHAPARPAHHPDHHSAAAALGRRNTAREHAPAGARPDAAHTHHLLREAGTGHFVPGRGPGGGVDGHAGHAGRRRRLLRAGAGALSQLGDANAGVGAII